MLSNVNLGVSRPIKNRSAMLRVWLTNCSFNIEFALGSLVTFTVGYVTSGLIGQLVMIKWIGQ